MQARQHRLMASSQGVMLKEHASSLVVQLAPCPPGEFLQGCSHGHAGCAPWRTRAALRAVKPAGHPRHQVGRPATGKDGAWDTLEAFSVNWTICMLACLQQEGPVVMTPSCVPGSAAIHGPPASPTLHDHSQQPSSAGTLTAKHDHPAVSKVVPITWCTPPHEECSLACC